MFSLVHVRKSCHTELLQKFSYVATFLFIVNLFLALKEISKGFNGYLPNLKSSNEIGVREMIKLICGSDLKQSRSELIDYCLNLLDIGGARFAYLVPTTELLKDVQEVLLNRLASRGITAFARPQIYLFDGFVNEFLKDWGLYRQPILFSEQKLVLRLVTRRLLEEGRLAYLGEIANYEGFYHSLQIWINEIKGTGRTPSEWLTNCQYSAKVRELGLIYQQYEEFLDGFDLVDNERNYQLAIDTILDQPIDSLGRGISHRLKAVVVDGFHQLNKLQLRFIQVLQQRGIEILIHSFQDEERKDSFKSLVEVINRHSGLTDTGQNRKIEEHREKRTDTDAILAHLKHSLFDLSASRIEGDERVSITYTPDKFSEIEHIGRQIKRLILERSDLCLGEIGVILPDLGDYQTFIKRSFGELEIPYQISEGTRLSRTPVFKLILSIYNIFATDWSRESLLTVLRSQYINITDQREWGKFEQLILEAGIITGKREWLNKFDWLEKRLVMAGETEYLEVLQRLKLILKEVIADLDKLAKKQSLLTHSQQLLYFLKKYQLAAQVVDTKETGILRRDLLSLDLIQQVLTRMVRFGTKLTGDQGLQISLPYREFVHSLQQRVDEIHLPQPKLMTDAVQILTAYQCRGKTFKVTFVGGLIEGDFPSYAGNDWLFSKEERAILEARGVHLKQDYEVLAEERLFFLEAISTAAERLRLTCPVLKVDDTAQSSYFIQEVLNLFIEDSVQEFEIMINSSGDKLPLTRRELEENLLRELWAGGAYPEVAAGLEKFTTKMTTETQNLSAQNTAQRIENLFQCGQMIKIRESAQFSEYDGVLRDDKNIIQLEQRFPYYQTYSISRLNDYAVCPFQFYCKRVLGLDEVEEPIFRLEPLELGNLYHQILYKFFREFPGWVEEPLAEATKRLQRVSAEILPEFGHGKSLPPGLWMVYQKEILENLERVLAFEYSEAEKQNYEWRPTWLETSFGLSEEYQEKDQTVEENCYQPVVIKDTDAGIEIKFGGKIDRIDLSKDGQYVIIYDYKFGSRDGLEAMEAGRDLQLPIYVKAAKQICGQDKAVLGAGYFSIKNCDRQQGIWRNTRVDLVPVSSRKNSCLDKEDWDNLLTQVDEFVFKYIAGIRKGDFRVKPAKECPKYCKFKKICRYDQTRIGLKVKAENLQEVATDDL